MNKPRKSRNVEMRSNSTETITINLSELNWFGLDMSFMSKSQLFQYVKELGFLKTKVNEQICKGIGGFDDKSK